MGAIMAEGLRVAALGICTVFAVLIILILILQIFKLFALKDNAAPKAAEAPAPVAPAVAPVQPAKDDLELIAVLTAAVNAYAGGSSAGGKLVVRSYRRVNGQNRAWNQNGRY